MFADDQLALLALRGEPGALAVLSARRLAPLAELHDAQRDRLLETLRSWLRHWGSRAEVSAELFVHPQTVSYRLKCLRELFGDDLDDPTARFEPLLVLAAPNPALRGSLPPAAPSQRSATVDCAPMAPARRPVWFILLAHWVAWVALAEGTVYVFRVRPGDTYEVADSIVGMLFYGSVCGLVTGALTLLWRVARSVTGGTSPTRRRRSSPRPRSPDSPPWL